MSPSQKPIAPAHGRHATAWLAVAAQDPMGTSPSVGRAPGVDKAGAGLRGPEGREQAAETDPSEAGGGWKRDCA